MLTSIRGLSAATLSMGLLVTAAPAFAETASNEGVISEELIAASTALDNTATSEDEVVLTTQPDLAGVLRASEPVDEDAASNMAGESGLTFSANIALTSEYRFRGVNLSNGNLAVQGGFDVGHSSGIYVGTWASNLDEDSVGFGSTELDIYGGWGGDLSDAVSADVGVIYYIYPDAPVGAGATDYIEFYGSLSFSIGPASITPGIAYAPSQDSLGNTDNTYLYTDLSFGIPDTPISLNAHVGYTDGFLTFTDDSKAFDWSLSADFALNDTFTLSAMYTGVEGDAANDFIEGDGDLKFTGDAFVVTLAASF